MPDREKVIEELKKCLSASCRGFRTCPYSDTEGWDAVEAALALLREQEPVRPERITIWDGNFPVENMVCGECHVQIDDGDQYCRSCGRKVKWDA